MDLWDVLRSTLRYWYVAAALLIVGLLVGSETVSRIEPVYEADATLLVIGPRNPEALNDNPLLALGSSLVSTTKAAQIVVNSPETRRAIRAQGLEPDYEVATENREPLLRIRVTSSDPQLALATVGGVIDAVDADLAARQDSLEVPTEHRIQTQALSIDPVARENDRARSRVQLALLGASILIAVLGARAFDLVLARIRAGSAMARAGAATQVPADDPSTPVAAPRQDLVDQRAAGAKGPQEHAPAGRPAAEPASSLEVERETRDGPRTDRTRSGR